MMIGAWNWINNDNATGSAYNNGAVYCLAVTVPASVGHGVGVEFFSPLIDTDGLSKLRIDLAGISVPSYHVSLGISDQDGNTLISDTLSVQGGIINTYDIPDNVTKIIVSIVVSMAAGTNVLKIRNIALIQ